MMTADSSLEELKKRQQGASSLGISEETKREYEFVVGIDFGTTYSGIAYSRVGDVDGHTVPVITEISKWPMRANQVTSQAPTKSVYKDGQLVKWGHQKPGPRVGKKGTQSISMFKLHLDENQTVNIPPLPQSVTIIKAISDYLKAIFDYACTTMSNTLGNEVDRSKLRFCLTVPAVWTEKAKITMRESAIQAGIVSVDDPQDRLLLVGEPEAAALYCETFIKQYDLGHDNNFLICDAGGGTVDLVVYRINVEDGESSLIEEVAGDGGMCGSVTLDSRFRAYIAKKVQELTTLPPLTDTELDEIVKAFSDGQKVSIYDPSDPNYDDDLIGIQLPHRYSGIETGDEELGMIDDCNLLVAPTEIIKHVFDPVVKQVLDLVDSQFHKVDKKLDAIFLVGGFGQSAYLFTKLKAKFYPQVRLVCTPSRGEMAIVRGAVLMGLNPRFVKQCVVRRTYGYECALEFEEGLDPEELKTKTKDGEAYCNKRFLQYALKGEIKDIDYYAETSFMSYYNGNPALHLFAYDGDIDKIPRHTTDKSVKKIIDFQIMLPHLPNKGPDDLIEIKIKFYLYQTEIKLQVEIENHVSIYTGSYRRESPKMLGDLTDQVDEKLKISADTKFGTQNIEPSYVEPVEEPEPEVEEEVGIQGYIPEPTK